MSDTNEPAVPMDEPANDVPGAEPPAQADHEAPPASAEPAPDAGGEADEGERPKGGFQRRIAELTAHRREAERDRDYWREVAMRGQQPQQQPQQQGKQPEPQLPPDLAQAVGPAPNPKDFAAGEFDPEYIRAAARHDIRVDQARMVLRQRQMQQQQAQAQFAQRINGIIEEGSKEYPDFADVALRPDVPLPPHVLREAADCDKPAAVIYWLAKNPKEAVRIASLRSPAAVARELTRVESKLAAAPPAPSNAPPPPKPLRGTAAAMPRDPAQARSMEEYVKLRSGG